LCNSGIDSRNPEKTEKRYAKRNEPQSPKKPYTARHLMSDSANLLARAAASVHH